MKARGDRRTIRLSRAPLRAYARWSPIDKGKDRLLTLAHATGWFADDATVAIAPDIELELDLTDYVQRSIYYRGLYEASSAAAFRRALFPGAVVVDAGAHVGQYTLLAAAAVAPGGTVVAFEPDPALRGLLRGTVERNRLANVRVLSQALSDSTGPGAFRRAPPDNLGMGRLVASGSGDIEVERARLDDLWPTLGAARLDVLKLDVEGAELPVLRGAAATIDRHQPTMLVESSDRNAAAFGYGRRDLERWLQDRGYRCAEITARGPVWGRVRGRGDVNLLCVHGRT